jgi:predicted transcriptional regulator
MSYRLQVLIPPELDSRLRKAAQRSRTSKGAWVRRALEESLRRSAGGGDTADDPVARLGSLDAPTADIQQMLSQIEAGRS